MFPQHNVLQVVRIHKPDEERVRFANRFMHLQRLKLQQLKLKRLQQRRKVEQEVRCGRESDYHNFDTFHRAINACIWGFQMFGLMPLKNVLHPNPKQVRFHVQSMAMLGTGFFLVFGTLRTLLNVRAFFEAGVDATNIDDLVFFFVTVAAFIMFLNLATHWPRLLQYWTRVEMTFLLPPYGKRFGSLRLKLRFLCCCFVLAAAVENSLYYASDYFNYRRRILHCTSDHSTVSFRDFLTTGEFQIYSLPINIFTVSCFTFLKICFHYTWNYMDLFVMLVSISLTTRFQQFAARLRRLEGVAISDAVWYDIRQHHIQLCELVEVVDEHLSPIILLSAMNDMYFICSQLLNIFTKLRWPINYAYFWYSLLFLLARTAGAFLCASSVHDASVAPIKMLYLVPTGHWTEEVQRFLAQLTNQCVALTGKRFYRITRKNLFRFFATLITYELVLLQLDAKDNQNKDLPDLCS